MELSLRVALPGGRVERIKADFPYEGSPVGFRVLVEGKTGLVVGVSDDGQVKEVVFPDKVPLTSEKEPLSPKGYRHALWLNTLAVVVGTFAR
jgi:primosomal protein N' (replication factor Y)